MAQVNKETPEDLPPGFLVSQCSFRRLLETKQIAAPKAEHSPVRSDLTPSFPLLSPQLQSAPYASRAGKNVQ